MANRNSILKLIAAVVLLASIFIVYENLTAQRVYDFPNHSEIPNNNH